MKWIKYPVYIFIIFVIFYFLYGEWKLPQDTLDWGTESVSFNDGWMSLDDNGDLVPVTIPSKYKGDITLVNKLSVPIPNDDYYILIRAEKCDVYVGNELRASYDCQDYRLIGTENSEAYFLVPLFISDEGKEIRVCMEDIMGDLYPIQLGSGAGIYYHLINSYGPELIVACLTLILSVITMIGCAILGLIFKRDLPLVHLAFCICFAALWIIFNSVLRDVVFHNSAFTNDMCFFMIMLIPFPMIYYLNALQKDRHRRTYTLCGIIGLADITISTFLFVTDILPLRKSFSYMSYLTGLIILIMGITLVREIISKDFLEYKFVAIGIICVLLAASIQIISFFSRVGVFSGMFIALGLIILLFFAIIHTVFEISSIEREKQSAIMANEAKGQFLANMSHEIRTPINAIIGMNEMILRESKNETINSYALDIQNAGNNLLSIVNNILDLSKVEAGKMELIYDEYDFSSLIHDISNMTSLRAQKEGLDFELKLDVNLPSRLYGDALRVSQILLNLLTNAVKYTQKGKVTLSINGTPRDEYIDLFIEVIDTGIGIKEEDLPKLYEKFERIEEKRNRNIEGTGLGMSIAINLLHMMGSSLDVESEYGKGTRFFFTLSQKIVSAEPIGNLEQRIREQKLSYQYHQSFIAKNTEILVVDDNAINRRVLKNLLKNTGIHITEAEDGEECLELLKDCTYDLIFLDHMMPKLDGIETIKIILDTPELAAQNIPIIALTANAISDAKEMYLKNGFTDYLSKPIISDKLENLLIKYLPPEKLTFIAADEIKNQRDENSNAFIRALSEMPDLNLDYARIFTKDEALLLDLAKSFCFTMPQEAEALLSHYESLSKESGQAEALKQYRTKVHSMKSASAMIGAMSLSGVAKMLEDAANNGNIEQIEKMTGYFLEEWNALYTKLAKVLIDDSEQEEKKNTLSLSELTDKLTLLKSSMEEMDVDTADAIIAELRNTKLPDSAKDDLRLLSAAVENLDEDSTATYVDHIITILEKEEAI